MEVDIYSPRPRVLELLDPRKLEIANTLRPRSWPHTTPSRDCTGAEVRHLPAYHTNTRSLDIFLRFSVFLLRAVEQDSPSPHVPASSPMDLEVGGEAPIKSIKSIKRQTT